MSLLTPFFMPWKPVPLLTDFLTPILDCLPSGPSAYVLAYVYLRRIKASFGADFDLHNLHRLFLAALLSASKFIDDDWFSIKHFAKLADVQVSDLVHLEKHFLFAIQFDLTVTVREFDQSIDPAIKLLLAIEKCDQTGFASAFA